MSKLWGHWKQNAPPTAQVALDRATEQYLSRPEYPGFWWARISQGKKGIPPIRTRKIGEVLVPGVSWEALLTADGDLLRVVPGFRLSRMIRVEAGSFLMSGRPVSISQAFYAGVYPVTQAAWKMVTGKNPSVFPGDPRLPVENVPWMECLRFCNRWSVLAGLNPVYQIDEKTGDVTWHRERSGLRLLTEAEWEYTAQAGENYRFAGSNNPDEVGWLSLPGSPQKTSVVGQKKPNKWGFYDMTGNVWEWVYDSYQALGTLPVTDPVETSPTGSRVLRGGSWRSQDFISTNSSRTTSAWLTQGDVGLRLACSVNPETPLEPRDPGKHPR